jgi:protein-tyrosine phosphatase
MQVSSAGVEALDGAPACPDAAAWLRWLSAGGSRGRHRAPVLEHAARTLTAEDVRKAPLILTAARQHRSAVARLVPAAQSKTFTIAQGARIASWQSVHGRGTAPPSSGAGRLIWLADQLDTGRGAAPRPEDDAQDDLPDPHQDGVGHEEVMRRILDAVHTFAVLLSGDPFPLVG